MNESALLLLNLQNDCMPQGALSIPGADAVIAVANQLMQEFPFVVAVKKSHPADHFSFAECHPRKKVGDTITINGKVQELWPRHCVEDSHGSALVSELDLSGIDHILSKGGHRLRVSYSAFFENRNRLATGLHTLLKFHKVKNLYILGISLDHDVARTAGDALNLGYQPYVIIDACYSAFPEELKLENFIKDLKAKNVMIVNSNTLTASPKQLHFEFEEE